MTSPHPCLLTVNGGSSSLKCAAFNADGTYVRILNAHIDRIGLPDCRFTVSGSLPADNISRPVPHADRHAAVTALMEWAQSRFAEGTVMAVGHRLVHGGQAHWKPLRMTPEFLEEFRTLTALDPEHAPHELLLIEAFQERFPHVAQVACFDTEFHHDMPRLAHLMAIPRRYQAQGVHRYGFHGLSYAYLLDELGRVAGTHAAHGRVILAHLGSGASMAAVAQGSCVDTTMGFTPAAGLMMGTRSGDIDPGLVAYLSRSEGMSPEQFDRMVNHESGLVGVSETSSDMRDLIAREKRDTRAAEAVDLFCYQVKKTIGAYAAVLNGLDTLIFSGGIGENVPQVRDRICAGLGYLGLDIERSHNNGNTPVISSATSRVAVRVMPTDEAVMIARAVCRVMGRGQKQERPHHAQAAQYLSWLFSVGASIT